ncbi:PepSY domain-containing protein, partial [Mycobacterium sp. ITM-2017-0098]
LNWHGAVGVWVLAGLLFLSATGITWSTYAGAHVADIRSALHWPRPQLDTGLDAEHAGHGGSSSGDAPEAPAIDYDAVLDAAARAG